MPYSVAAVRGKNHGRRLVLPPSGFDWILPFSIYRGSNNFSIGSWNISSYAPTGKTYYVNRSMPDDSGDGLSLPTAFQKVDTALSQPDIDIALIAAGHYEYGFGWNSTVLARSVSVKAISGSVKLSTDINKDVALTWTPNGTYPNVWQASLGSSIHVRVFDAKTLTDGDESGLVLRSNVSQVNSNPGSYYYSGGIVYVRLVGSRAIDSDVRVYRASGAYSGRASGAITVYLEGIDFSGGDAAFYAYAAVGPSSPTLYVKNCKFFGAYQNGLTCEGVTAYLQSCIAAYNRSDGTNFHIGTTVVPKSAEIDCIGRYNGYNNTSDINNGSSIHDGGSMVRVNGEHHHNRGRNVHDVTVGTESWNLGVYSHDSTSIVNTSDFAVGTGGGAGEMWLDTCIADGNVEADVLATMYLHNCTVGGQIGGGSFVNY